MRNRNNVGQQTSTKRWRQYRSFMESEDSCYNKTKWWSSV